MTNSRTRATRWAAVGVIATALTFSAFTALANDAPTGGDILGDSPIPVEPDGGIGDSPIPVEPDGGIGSTD